MPLVTIKEQLSIASRSGYAVPLFDTFDLHSTDGMFAALEDRRAPGIVAIYAGMLDRPNGRAFAEYIKCRANEASVPVSLMLDHGSSFEQCMRAISYGFADVMYDGSSLSIEENIETTCAVVRAAHAVGVAVEAELGHVGRGSEYQEFGAQRKGFTDPASVERFVEETGVDFLAVAIGTAHGLYAGDPHLDLDLLSAIRERVDIPLVLHGGSGCTEEQFRGAIQRGIAKVNVATDLMVTAARKLVELAREKDAGYFDLTGLATSTFQERCSYYLDLFGTSGKA